MIDALLPAATRPAEPCGPPPRPPSIAWILPVILIEFTCVGLPAAIMPQLLKTAFGSGRAITYLGISQGVKGLVAFASGPVIGALSDRQGRRLWLLATAAGTAAPYSLLAFVPSLEVFLYVNAACGVFYATFSLVMAYLADVTPPESRMRAFGLALAMFGLSFSGSPYLGTWLAEHYGAQTVWYAVGGLALLNLFYVAAALPESLPPSRRQPADAEAGPASGAPAARLAPPLPWRAFRSSRALRVLAAVAMADELAEQLLITLLLQYLADRFSFSPTASAALLAEVGIVSALSLTLVLALLKRRMSDLRILQLALLANAVSIGAIGAAWLPWQPFVAVGGCLLAFLVFPAIAGLVSNSVADAEQGEAQGAINGVKALCDGLSPLLYGPLFALFKTTPLPGGPFVLAAGVVALALAGLSLPAVVAIVRPAAGGRGARQALEPDVS